MTKVEFHQIKVGQEFFDPVTEEFFTKRSETEAEHDGDNDGFLDEFDSDCVVVVRKDKHA